MEIKKYIKKIVENGNDEDMHELTEIYENVMHKLKEYDEECYNKYKMELYELAYGKVLTDEMKEKWVSEMRPMAKWTKSEVENVINNYGVRVPKLSAYVIMNMLYSDMKSALGDGESEESLKRYLNATNDWYFDEDINNTEESKLFNYWKYIVK